MVNGKMCINVSGDDLMCRFHPSLQETVALKKGYRPMIMKGKEISGYAYVSKEGLQTQKDLDTWINLCLVFNTKAKALKKTKKKA